MHIDRAEKRLSSISTSFVSPHIAHVERRAIDNAPRGDAQ